MQTPCCPPTAGRSKTTENLFILFLLLLLPNPLSPCFSPAQLQRILKHIAEKQQKDLYGSFNPRAAMFVCNRWDLVPGPEKDTVLRDTVRKLSRSWPNMDRSQVFCLSTTKAWNTKMAGYVAEDFSEFLDGIQRLVPIGLQRKIQLSYK